MAIKKTGDGRLKAAPLSGHPSATLKVRLAD